MYMCAYLFLTFRGCFPFSVEVSRYKPSSSRPIGDRVKVASPSFVSHHWIFSSSSLPSFLSSVFPLFDSSMKSFLQLLPLLFPFSFSSSTSSLLFFHSLAILHPILPWLSSLSLHSPLHSPSARTPPIAIASLLIEAENTSQLAALVCIHSLFIDLLSLLLSLSLSLLFLYLVG